MGDNAPRMLGARSSQSRNSFTSSISFGDAATPSPKTKGSHVKVLGDGMGGPSGLSSSGRAGSGSSLTKDSPDGDRSSRNSFSINPEADIGKLATAGTPKPTVAVLGDGMGSISPQVDRKKGTAH